MDPAEFQSTPPARAATGCDNRRADRQHVSIHAAREGGDRDFRGVLAPELAVSIHAAREGGDPNLPARLPRREVSIHAAREGGDSSEPEVFPSDAGFNPRRPRGRRRALRIRTMAHPSFQSTPPARAATRVSGPASQDKGVSIHAAREGGDEDETDRIE